MRATLLFIMIMTTIGCKKSITEMPPIISSIRFDNTDANLILGKTMKLSLSYLPNNATEPTYEYSSTNPNVLSVNENGIVSANSIGTASIIAQVKGLNVSTEFKIIVIPDVITSLNIDKPQIKLFVGQKETINLSILPITALSASVTWSSSDPSVAEVTSAGLVTGLSAGSTIITVKSQDGKVSAKSNIEVLKEVEYSRDIFDKIKTDLLDHLILYNEQQGKSLAQELKAGKIGYIVLAESAVEEVHLTSNPGYPEAMFSKLTMPKGDVLRVKSHFYLELFPNTSRVGSLTLDINFFEKSWEVKTIQNLKTYKYSDNVSLAELKIIIDQNISKVRKYVTTGSY